MSLYVIFDLALFAIFVAILGRLLWVRRKDIAIQRLISIGKVPIVFLAMLRTTWGIKLMDRWGEKYGGLIRFLGFASIGLSVTAAFVGLWLMGLVAWMLFTDPIQASIVPALPFTNLPVIGYLSFTHWIIIIAIIVTLHEFAHGVVARAFKVPVKKSGIAIVNLILPIIPAAFVEPDEKVLRKNEGAFYATIAAGPAINIVTGLLFFLVLAFVLIPMQAGLTEPVGFSLDPTANNTPAAIAGFSPELIINNIEGIPVTDSTHLITLLTGADYSESLTLTGYNETSGETFTKTIEAEPHPDREGGYIGAFLINQIRYGENVWYQDIFEWFLKLFQLLFLFSVFVGILNMLPITIADGGQIFMFLLEGKGKRSRWAAKIIGFITLVLVAIILAGIGVWIYFSLTGGFGDLMLP